MDHRGHAESTAPSQRCKVRLFADDRVASDAFAELTRWSPWEFATPEVRLPPDYVRLNVSALRASVRIE